MSQDTQNGEQQPPSTNAATDAPASTPTPTLGDPKSVVDAFFAADAKALEAEKREMELAEKMRAEEKAKADADAKAKADAAPKLPLSAAQIADLDIDELKQFVSQIEEAQAAK